MLLFPCAIRNTIECAFHEYSIVANRIVDAFRCGGFEPCVLIWAVLQSKRRRRQNTAGRKTMGKDLRLLFIGNSHPCANDMPLMAAKKARAAGYDCEVTMIAHGGWFLATACSQSRMYGLIFCSAIMTMLFYRSMRIRLDRRRSFSMRRGN